MAIGRISGPLLAKNLLRDGVDLAFETDLLYLDVTSGRIGIRKNNPAYELDVNGTINATINVTLFFRFEEIRVRSRCLYDIVTKQKNIVTKIVWLLDFCPKLFNHLSPC